jgi:uncharacterized protein (DUF1800 family)
MAKRKFPWVLCLACALAGCTLSPSNQENFSVAQTAAALTRPDPTLLQGRPAQWRAINRLTYGPTPEGIVKIQAAKDPLDWALMQLDAARAASRQPARLPADLADLGRPLPALFEGARHEREARANVPPGTALDEALPGDKRFDFSVPASVYFFNRTQANKAIAWRLAACSNDEAEQALLARMTEFWFNYFNVHQNKGSVRPFAGHYALHVARAHALGKFEDLVLASARHPAMLYYLDQWQSVSPALARGKGSQRGLNENYARELMELHTLGVNGGYTQLDVRALAHILTGWTVSPQIDSGFEFVARNHTPGTKKWLTHTLGGTLANTGLEEGEQAIRILSRHPATARRVSTRLAQYFVADTPSQALVDAMSSMFLQTNGDIYWVMQVMIRSDDFWRPESRLYRTPFDFACGALRTVQAGQNRGAWLQALNYTFVAGQPIQNWQTPDGYALDAATWLSPESLTRRIDFALNIARQAPLRQDLYAYLSPPTAKTIQLQPTAQRMGLMLGSPEFLYK